MCQRVNIILSSLRRNLRQVPINTPAYCVMLYYITDSLLKNVLNTTKPWPRTAEICWGPVTKFFINFEETLSRAHGNFEKQNEVLESSIIIINYSVTNLLIFERDKDRLPNAIYRR